MAGVRMSGLPLSQYCGQSALLDKGAGRAAAQSTAWHAACALSPGYQNLLARLTDEEQAEVKTWKRPEDVEVAPGIVLRYDDAEHELEVAVDKYGRAVSADSPSAESVGHLDMAWAVEVNERRVAYVPDLKRTEFTATEGVNTLQLVAYGFAYAALRGCEGYCPGIWAAIEGRWTWGEIVWLDSPEAEKLWERCLAAMRNVGGEFNRGVHCRGCWSRFQCPAHLLPPDAATGSLAIMAGQEMVTGPKVAQLVLDIKRAEDTIRKAKEFAEDWEARHPGEVVADGKKWRPVRMPGRESLDKEKLLSVYPDAAKFVKRGSDYSMMKWTAIK